MPLCRLILCLCLAALGLPSAAFSRQVPTPGPPTPCVAAGLVTEGELLTGHELPIIKAYRYAMTGRIRPLLFWISRDGVGHGQIVWRADTQGATAIELFVSSDPARAPRGIDRWGYLIERVHSAATRVTGVISSSEEATLAEVNKSLDAGKTRARFKAIEARIDQGWSCVVTSVVEASFDRYQREIPAVVRQARERLLTASVKATPVPAGVRAGFFAALVEMIDRTAAARRSAAGALARLRGSSVPYLYGTDLYDLTLADVALERSPVVPAPAGAYVMHAVFEVKTRATGDRQKFELQYATEGDMSGVPTLIRIQPRWWIQVDLVLTGPDESAMKPGVGLTSPSAEIPLWPAYRIPQRTARSRMFSRWRTLTPRLAICAMTPSSNPLPNESGASQPLFNFSTAIERPMLACDPPTLT